MYQINIWRHFFNLMAERPTHTRDIQKRPLTLTGVKEASVTRMGAIFCIPSENNFVWILPEVRTTA